MTAAELASRVNARRMGDHYQARCPGHDDRNPSLDFTDGQEGVVVYCRSQGCRIEDICRGWGIRPAELFFNQRSEAAFKARWAPITAPMPKWWRDPKLAGLHYGVMDTARHLDRLAEEADLNARIYGERSEGWQWAEFSAMLRTEAERLATCTDWASVTNRPAAEEE